MLTLEQALLGQMDSWTGVNTGVDSWLNSGRGLGFVERIGRNRLGGLPQWNLIVTELPNCENGTPHPQHQVQIAK